MFAKHRSSGPPVGGSAAPRAAGRSGRPPSSSSEASEQPARRKAKAPALAPERVSYGTMVWIADRRFPQPSPHWWLLLQQSVSAKRGDVKVDPLRGKQGPGETPQDTAARETWEESLTALFLEPRSLGRLFGPDATIFHVVAEPAEDDPMFAQLEAASPEAGAADMVQLTAATQQLALAPQSYGRITVPAGAPPLVTQIVADSINNLRFLEQHPEVHRSIDRSETDGVAVLNWAEVMSVTETGEYLVEKEPTTHHPRIAKQVVGILRDVALRLGTIQAPIAPGLLSKVALDMRSLPHLKLRRTRPMPALYTWTNREQRTGVGVAASGASVGGGAVGSAPATLDDVASVVSAAPAVRAVSGSASAAAPEDGDDGKAKGGTRLVTPSSLTAAATAAGFTADGQRRFVEIDNLAKLPPGGHLSRRKLLTQVPAGHEPVVLVSLGSFSPPTMMHFRIMEDCRDHINRMGHKTVIGGYLSPVHEKYGKASLAAMHHRVNMVALGLADSDWLELDFWECLQPDWTRTAISLERIAKELESVPIRIGSDAPRAGLIKVMMVCGADLLDSFKIIKPDGQPLWSPEHREIILERNGIACLKREGTDLEAVINQDPQLVRNRANILLVDPAVQNQVSSTIVRRQLAEGKSIKYLVHDAVREYIYRHNLDKLPNWQ